MNRNTLLIVDDMEVNRAILRSLFEQDYNLLEAENGEQGLMLLNQYKDTIAAVLLDIVMPVKDGYEVMAEMSRNRLLDDVPVIVITAQDSTENEVRAFDLGASDIVMKPFEPHVVRRRVENVVELNRHKRHLEELVEEQAINLRESKAVLMDALSSVIEHRSIESGQHVLRIRMFTKLLLEDVKDNYSEYGLDDRKIDIISSAAALHDIGKIAIPDAILNKPGRLTAEEFQIMKTHAEKGCEILAGLDRMHDKEYLQYAYSICRYHHERWDGNGYPDGLIGENIPICAQAAGVADAYDALTTNRVYKRAYTPEKACNMILNGECGLFSPKLLECFKNVQEPFAELSREYADGKSPGTDFEMISTRDDYKTEAENTLELGQMKYFAMLRYEDSTVMEVDADSGIYHLVYTQNSDFDLLRSGDLFEESYQVFVEKAVHPDDRMGLLKNHSIDVFLASGAMKRSLNYRVFHQGSGNYIWYGLSILRINIENPRQHKLLMIWRKLKDYAGGPAVSPKEDRQFIDNSLVGIQQCFNDGWFTIRHINEGFITLFGYSREEIERVFQNRFIEMIYPDDREKVLKYFRKEQSVRKTFEYEYRILTKDGRVLWVLDKSQLFTGEDGVEYMNCVLIDVTHTKQEQEKLRLTMERHQIIMDQTNDIIFEWDIHQNKILYSSNWVKKFGYQPITEEIDKRIPQASHVLPEDMPNFLKLMKDVETGAPYGETELRIANTDSQYIWCRIRATTQFNNDGKPVKAVGVIVDIDSEKRHAQDLIDKAERDHLTHLFNKNAARTRIQSAMKHWERNGTAAMMIIDLDNFKTINDNFGHMFGDAVLMEVAGQLQKLFRSEDVVSRIGGDEFLVYINSLPDQNVLAGRAENLIATMRTVLPDELHLCPLSCSVGVACFPKDAIGFQELFQCCDRALYYAKAQGKNQFAMYDKLTMAKTFDINSQQAVTANTRIESDEAFDFDNAAVIQQASQLLYRAEDMDAAVQSILELIGCRYHVSRAYIFEESEDHCYCRNTFEWCNEGIEPQIKFLQHVAYADIGDYHENFDENGVFYCPDISILPKPQCDDLAVQRIRSMLQCAIQNEGEFVGFVGFDDCTARRMWTQSQIKTLSFIAELLSTYLLKKRAQENLAQAVENLHTLLDSQNSWIYVIDPNTYELRYINAKTSKIAPAAKVGMSCHKAFFDRMIPCAACPMKDIRKNTNKTMEIYNPLLKVWSLADASLIRWGSQEACLLSCHDITPYKNLIQENAPADWDSTAG
ncbi:diguanylate cyclase [Ruminococcus sp. OA3]|uniref:diguanylate cyclase n=1 Tax=Ruminococcus sp. OA3 TaxID=2914164 RepID=UPI001F05E794|nr:diguanylate cyclase [Ruminococcus sp. OA3]MCH1983039.1 diguanylate cyclase [Ruminococcus sp. OA3]